ncbi:FadR/GntR family transcriptional regulator [Actinomadura parmotrematis]|uniref:FCD domain-containing protein n=1 Tax=Actinomadura parmotrematis TaxID=2864039 RepID=A0ABS7G431_9ACTN|nr:FCD domain-containing protein [Actinomadura parmotrematis]MBW8487474.1 FCD domain-containing protein [Actinomadura parmotrematis]
MGLDDPRLAVFSPVDSTARVDVVVRRLADAIALELLADGEQLPSELELAARLGVSTVTLREALVSLRHLGLVETRRGRGGGSFVRTPKPADAGALPPGLSPQELRDFGDHYAAISGAAARLAAERSLAAELAPLRRTVKEMDAAGGAAELRRLDGRFHIEVAAASQSARLTREEIALQADAGLLLWLPYGPADGAAVARRHREIFAAIASGDGEAARTLAERHILEAVERMVELRLRD